MKVSDEKTLSLLVNLSIASARLRKITVEQDNGKFNMRPQIHLIISGSPGSLKSTVLQEIALQFRTIPFNDITEPALVGSIDNKTMQFLEGCAWTCRNGVLVLDEFEFTSAKGQVKGIVKQLLSLTEHEQQFRKKIARFSGEIHEEEDDLYLNVKNGMISLKTNFALIIGTMHSLNFSSISLTALRSRCLPIVWNPGFELILSVANGNLVYRYEDLLKGWKKRDKKVLIKNEDYNLIKGYLVKSLGNHDLFLRVLGDLCRVFAILKKHDYSIYDLIIKLKSSN